MASLEKRGPGRHNKISPDVVLKAASELFAKNGYRSTSLTLVAEELGVTRQAFYYHFKSKDEILGALFDLVMSAFEDAAQVGATAPDGSAFMAIVREQLKVVISNRSVVSVIVHERPEIDAVIGKQAHERRRGFNQTLVDALERDVAAGSYATVDPRLQVNLIVTSLLAIPTWLPRSAPAGTNFIDRVCSAIEHGLHDRGTADRANHPVLDGASA